MELGQLILRQCLGGKEIQGAAVGAFQNCIQDGQVVAKRFAGSGRRDNDNVFSGTNRFGGGGLMAIELAIPLSA
jgi:hypothetical protein